MYATAKCESRSICSPKIQESKAKEGRREVLPEELLLSSLWVTCGTSIHP